MSGNRVVMHHVRMRRDQLRMAQEASCESARKAHIDLAEQHRIALVEINATDSAANGSIPSLLSRLRAVRRKEDMKGRETTTRKSIDLL